MPRDLRAFFRPSFALVCGCCSAVVAQDDCTGFIFLTPGSISLTSLDQTVEYVDPLDVAIEDVTGNGLPDLIVCTGPRFDFGDLINNDHVCILKQVQPGVFGSPEPIIETIGTPVGVPIRAIEVGDFNGDMMPDIAAVTQRIEVRDPPGGPVIGTAPAKLMIAINNGAGDFLPAFEIPAFPSNLTDLVVGDFDGDGQLDAAASVEFSGSVSRDVVVFWGTMFGLPIDVRTYAGPDESTSIVSADLNGDGLQDMIVGDKSGQGRVRLLLQRAGRDFDTQTIQIGASGPTNQRSVSRVVATDIDSDGALDIVASSPRAEAVYAWINQSEPDQDPVYLSRTTLINTPGCDWLEVTGQKADGSERDLDDNGVPDLVVFDDDVSGGVRVYSGDGAGGYCLLESLPMTRPQRGVIANIEGDASGDDDVDLLIASDTNGFGTLVPVFNGGDRNCDAIDGDDQPDDKQDFMDIATWNFAENGSFHDEEVWCPIEVPGVDKRVLFKRDGMYTVELGRECGVAGCEQYRVKRFTVEKGMPSIETLGFSMPNLTIGDDLVEGEPDGDDTARDGDLTVGTTVGTPAMLEILSGELTVGFNLFERRDTVHIGVDPGTEGALVLDGPSARLDARAARVRIGTDGQGLLSVDRGFFEAGEVSLGKVGSDPDPRGRLVVRGNAFANIEAAINVFSGGQLAAYDSASIFSSGTVSVLGGSIIGNMNEGSNGITAGTNNRGLVSPGDTTNPIGRLNFSSTYTQRDGNSETTGRLAIDVAGIGDGEFDVLEVNGLATLGGSLTVNAVTNLDELGADVEPVRFIGASNISGQFDVALLPGLRDGRFFNLVYTREGSQRGVSLELSSLGNEFGFDGTIDPDLNAEGGPVAVQLAHMDSDEDLDVVVVISGNADAPQPVPGALLVLINAGFDENDEWAGFESAINRPLGLNPTALAIGDLDGDGTNDIAVTHNNESTDEVRIGLNADNDGAVTFFPNQFFTDDPTAIVIADFNEDGGNDIAVAGVDGAGAGSLAVRLNTNTTIGSDWQGLELTVSAFPSGAGTTFMDIGDFDNDTCIDIFLTSDDDNGLNIFTNQGLGAGQAWNGFGKKDVRPTGPSPVSAYIADLNLDSDPDAGTPINRDDIIVVDNELNQLTVLLNNNTTPGEIRFSPPANIPFASAPLAVTAGDYDGDGDPDVATIVVDSGTMGRSLLLLRNDLDTGTGQVQFAEDDLGVPQPENPVLLASGDVSLDDNEDLVAITGDLPAPGMPRGGTPSFVRPFFISPQSEECNVADLAEPFGVLDLADISVFVTGFAGNDPIVDFDQNGIFDLQDISIFVTAFTGGCP